jgi:hypothetical protein
VIRAEALDYLTFPANVDEQKYLNLALESLMRGYEGDAVRDSATFVVQPDENGEGFITLPRRWLAIRGAVSGEGIGFPLQVRNGWYEYSPGGIGMRRGSDSMRGVIPLQGRFTTFSKWNIPLYLRFKFEQNEDAGTIIVRGTLVGQKIWKTTGGASTEGENVAFGSSGSPSATVTTTNVFDAEPYQIIKPVTKGRVSMYTVDGDGTETLVAIYDPSERSPRWRRYKVPILPTMTERTLVPIPIGGLYTASQLETFFGQFDPLTVNTDGTTTLNPSSPYSQWYQKVIAQAGSGAYTYVFRLSRISPLAGAIFRIQFEVAASSNPTIEVYDNDEIVALQAIAGDFSNPTYALLEMEFTGSVWQKIALNFLT